MSYSYGIIKEHLERLLVNYCKDLSITERTELEILKDKFSAEKAPFR